MVVTWESMKNVGQQVRNKSRRKPEHENKGTRPMKEMTDTSIEEEGSLAWTSSEGTTRLTPLSTI